MIKFSFYNITLIYKQFLIIVLYIFVFKELKSAVTAQAGNNTEICSGSTVQLGGSPVASGGSGNYSFIWSPATDLNNPTDSVPVTSTVLSTTYQLVVTDNITLEKDTSYITITVNPQPVVSAGANQLVCVTSNIVSLSLNGSISGITNTGIWTTSGDGYFPIGKNQLLTSYNLGPNDKINDSVLIILTSTNNGNCLPSSDTVLLKIFPKIIADAGNDSIICLNETRFLLNGTVTGSTYSGSWTTNGNGSFLPGANNPVTYYIPDSSDFYNNDLYMILSSTNNGECPGSTDTTHITLKKYPVIYTGSDTSINSRTINLIPEVFNAEHIKWTSSGKGSFYPSDTSKNIKYIYNTNELVNNDQVILKLTSNSSDCPVVSDSVIVSNISASIPNSFTPDNDGYNDYFMKGDQITVFNRWGQILYEGRDGWDGTYKNMKVSSGTYFYILTYNNGSGISSVKKGSVTVIIK